MESFHFLRPGWLAAIPLALPLFVLAWRRAGPRSDWARICDAHLLRYLVVQREAAVRRWPLLLAALAWAAASLALAGPTWQRLPQASFANTARTVLVAALSPSMDERDVAPSRLARARHKLGDAALRLAGGSVGLVVYREEAFPAVPLTDDAAVLRELIPLLETGLAPGRAVYPARGLEEAKRVLEPVGTAGAQVLLVSDGGDDDSDATLRAAADLARAGARVSVLAIGENGGALEAVARAGGGSFATLRADDSDLDALLVEDATEIGAPLTKTGFETDSWRDMGAWLLWIPLLLAPLAFRKGWATAFLLLAFFEITAAPARAGVLDWFERPDQQAARAFEEGDYTGSAELFQDPSWSAAARYRAGDYEAAASLLAEHPDPESQYNRGNALAQAGRLEDALAAYETALASDPDHADALFNRDLVKKLLEEESAPKPQGSDEDQDQQAQEDAGKGSGGGAPDDSATDQADANGSQGSGDEGEADQESGAKADTSTAADAGSEQPADSELAAADGGGSDESESRAEPPSPEPGSSANAVDQQKLERASDESSTSSERPPTGGAHEQAAANPNPTEEGRPAGEQRPAPGAPGTALSGEEQANARWMARLPDDPGGLLREKMRRDYVRRLRARGEGARP